MTLGLTVSHWSGDVDFEKAKSAGVRFVSIKATQGKDSIDGRFPEYWRDTGRAGLLRRAYHYMTDDDPVAQAEHFWSIAGKGDLPPALDLETTGIPIENVRAWLQTIEEKASFKPEIYTRKNIWETYGGVHWASQYGLWLAQYEVDEPTPIDDWWGEWLFWQYTDDAVGESYGVMDNTAVLDLYNGTEARLNYYASRYLSGRILPRVRLSQPERTKVVPSGASPALAAAIALEAVAERTGLVFAYDSVRRGIAELYNINEEQHLRFFNWYARHYPDVQRVEFKRIEV